MHEALGCLFLFCALVSTFWNNTSGITGMETYPVALKLIILQIHVCFAAPLVLSEMKQTFIIIHILLIYITNLKLCEWPYRMAVIKRINIK